MEKENDPIDACDAPLLELHIQISSIWNDRKKLRAENKILKGLLEIAICPNATVGCKDGLLINPHGELGVTDKCQWCDMTKQALKV